MLLRVASVVEGLVAVLSVEGVVRVVSLSVLGGLVDSGPTCSS